MTDEQTDLLTPCLKLFSIYLIENLKDKKETTDQDINNLITNFIKTLQQ